jgi:O-antigen/teichoic acid export membrane protein
VHRRLTRDPLTRGWAIVTSAGLVRLGLGFVSSLVVARALGPANFGTYAVLAATVGLIGGLGEGGLTEAAVLRLAADHQAAPRRARAFFWLRVGLASVVVALGCAVAGPVANQVLHVDDDLLRWALLGIVATAASGAVSAMLQALGAFGRMSWLSLVNAGLTAVLAVGLAAFGWLDLRAALIVLGIGTSLATFGVGWALLPRTWSLALPPARRLRHEAGVLLRTGRWLWLASLFALLTANAEVLLLNRFADLAVVGQYALALSLATKADVVNHSLYTVLLPGAARLRGRAARRTYVRQGLQRGGVLALGLLAITPLAEPFVTLFYGADYAPAARYLQLLLGVMAFDVLLTPVLLLPLGLGRPRWLAVADALRAGTLIGVGLLAIPTFGGYGAVAARFAARLAGALFVLGALWSARPALEVEDQEPAQPATAG